MFFFLRLLGFKGLNVPRLIVFRLLPLLALIVGGAWIWSQVPSLIAHVERLLHSPIALPALIAAGLGYWLAQRRNWSRRWKLALPLLGFVTVATAGSPGQASELLGALVGFGVLVFGIVALLFNKSLWQERDPKKQ